MTTVPETDAHPSPSGAQGLSGALSRPGAQGRPHLPPADRPTVSFELFPPRTPEGEDRLTGTLRALEQARPDFVSVTYGASGRTRVTTRRLVSKILRTTSLTPIAHLTCVDTSKAETVAVIEEFLDAGVRSFLALRGDPPAGQTDWRPHPDGLHTAAELVALLRAVEADRCARSQAQVVRGLVKPLSVAVAAFPRGNHATGGTRADDVRALLDKQRAGADFAITQIFWDAPSYLALVAEAQAAGVTIPIIPGILPATDPDRLVRVGDLAGVPPPRDLLDRLATHDDPGARYRAGVRATADLVDAVLDGGAPGIHVYTFNQHQPALDLLAATHLGGLTPSTDSEEIA
ncbi:MAG: methylenetetrahydrofolate reductase [Micrococcales bacterium]|nr:methylenetetrahydrofolate reductase [Micrococcales bacterium]